MGVIISPLDGLTKGRHGNSPFFSLRIAMYHGLEPHALNAGPKHFLKLLPRRWNQVVSQTGKKSFKNSRHVSVDFKFDPAGIWLSTWIL